ncbi:unnamed protein product [Cuscuta europaea]|uniref:Uncharacterized protein n=1 Tax=Cuscuta europaea TaxID=41803 RepID=A0A9P0ZE66_CUSEU|nr:unnamed protein product [Cuscuta europaea]
MATLVWEGARGGDGWRRCIGNDAVADGRRQGRRQGASSPERVAAGWAGEGWLQVASARGGGRRFGSGGDMATARVSINFYFTVLKFNKLIEGYFCPNVMKLVL